MKTTDSFLFLSYSADTKLIKEGEESKRKSYQALVWFSQPLTQDIVDRCNKKGRQPFVAYQKTPIRVFQR
jgi:tRNA pseudouridine synthase 10